MDPKLIEAFQAFFTDEKYSDEAAEGSIAGWMKGEGQLPADLVNSDPMWQPVIEAYSAAHTASSDPTPPEPAAE